MDFTVRSRRINRSNKRSSINATLSGSISQTNAVPSLAKLGSAAAVIVLAVGWHLVPLPRFGWLSHSSDVITVISTAGPDSVARKQRLMLEQRQPSNYYRVHSIILNPDQQRTFVQANGCGIKRFNELGERHQEHLAVELFKYCALSKQVGDALYVDANSPLIVPLDDVLAVSTSFAVLGYAYFPETIHGSLLMLRKDQNYLAREMVQLIVDTPIDVLEASPLLIQRTLYKLIVDSVSATSTTHAPKQRHTLLPGKNGNGWFLFEQKCRMNPLRRLNGWATQNSDEKKTFSCPAKNEFCCSVQDSSRKQVVVMNRHPTLPYQRITETMREPYNAGKGFYAADELPYISTVREVTFKRPKDMPQTKNLYELFYDNDKLPSIRCIRCLHLKSCLDFKRYCVKYLKDLCAEPPPTKFVAKEITVTPPLYRRDPSRLVPRIVHQTWYETMDPEKYPNMSRLVESWKRSGWEYKFYSDEDAEQFLSTHFPREVLEAYQSLIPGAFKADLFRYCALLIHGGVYADVDIMLESSLDVVVEPDVGFMVPMDVPEGCVWQGFIAAAPGHPFLALAIQTVVNQVRNKFTSIDYDATFCPNPRYKVLHTFDVLFTAGPCLMGSSMNRVLGRHGQSLFEPGTLVPEWIRNATHVRNDRNVNIPGRTVILKQDKMDMGAHRFTFEAQNMVVAATDLENSDDRKNWPKQGKKTFAKPLADNLKDAEEDEPEGGEHYSKAHAKTGIYGIDGLYVDHDLVDEDVHFVVDESRLLRMMSSIDLQQPNAIF